MADWNYDINQAPRGRIVDQTVTDKHGKTKTVGRFERDVIIAASKCGKVTSSYFIPEQNRWCMFAEGELPIAWQPWPEHPHAG